MRFTALNHDSLVLHLVLHLESVLHWSCTPSAPVRCARWSPPPTLSQRPFLSSSRHGPASSLWAAKWRSADGSRIKRRLGSAAWLERDGRRWRPRSGRPRPGYLTERQARRAMAALVRAVEADAAVRRDATPAPSASGPTFQGTGPSVARASRGGRRRQAVHPAQLPLQARGAGDAPPARLGRARGRIMAALGDTAPADITAGDVSALLDAVAADGASRRTVNRHREIVVAILNFGLRPERRADWGLTENAASAAPKRRVEHPARLEVFTVEQIEALARAAETGRWRTGRPYDTPLHGVRQSPLDDEHPLAPAHVAPPQRDDLAAPQARIGDPVTVKDDRWGTRISRRRSATCTPSGHRGSRTPPHAPSRRLCPPTRPTRRGLRCARPPRSSGPRRRAGCWPGSDSRGHASSPVDEGARAASRPPA